MEKLQEMTIEPTISFSQPDLVSQKTRPAGKRKDIEFRTCP
jgi:hypothetical protein